MVITNTKTAEFITINKLPEDWGIFLYDPPIQVFMKSTIISIGFHNKKERSSLIDFLNNAEVGQTIIMKNNDSKWDKKDLRWLDYIRNRYLLYNIYEGECDRELLKEIKNKK